MNRAEADGRWVEYEERGSGEPVLLIHGTLIADTLAPLLEEPALSGYRLIRYRRRGFCGNTIPRGAGWLSMADHAADAAMLLEHLEIAEAHVLGHDMGGSIAIQLALDQPHVVHSLALLEPLLLGVPSAEPVLGEVSPALDLFLSGDRPGAVEAFLSIGSGEESGEMIESRLPGAMKRAAEDCESFFEGEMFAIGEWSVPEHLGFEISQPVLSTLSEHPIGFFADGRSYLHDRLPQVEDLDVFNATHLLPLENPEMLATGLAWFLGRHPIRR